MFFIYDLTMNLFNDDIIDLAHIFDDFYIYFRHELILYELHLK